VRGDCYGRSCSLKAILNLYEQRVEPIPTRMPEEIDLLEFFDTMENSCPFDRRRILLQQSSCRGDQFIVAGGAELTKRFLDLLIAQALEYARSKQPRRATFADDLAANPFEVLAAVFAFRQQVGGVLDGKRANLGKPPENFGSKVGGLRGDLMKE